LSEASEEEELAMWKVFVGAVLLWSADASAQSRAFETTDQAGKRHSAERWHQYEQRGY